MIGLAEDIGVLMTYFVTMNEIMRTLKEAHADSREIIEEIEEGKAENRRDSEELNESRSDFRDEILKMKSEAARIQIVASLYAAVITEIVNPAFGRLLMSGHGDILNQDVKSVIETKRSLMRSYVERAQAVCRVKAEEATRLMQQRLADISTGAAA